jgi:DNA ligase (NAD+)
VGETISEAVSTFFHDEGNIKTLESLRDLGLRLENPDFNLEEKAEGPLAGMTFVITGTLPAARKEVEELIERHGGHAASQVSASTDYLIVGENPGSKKAKAERLGVKTITYTDLLGLTGEGKGG